MVRGRFQDHLSRPRCPQKSHHHRGPAVRRVAPTRIDKYPNYWANLRRVFERCAKDGKLRAWYEESGAGNVLQRAVQEWGYHGDVVRPRVIDDSDQVAARRRNQEFLSSFCTTSTRMGRDRPLDSPKNVNRLLTQFSGTSYE